jgi:hypothetical protein
MAKHLGRSAIVAVLGGMSILALSATAWAVPAVCEVVSLYDFDFAPGQYPLCFRDVVRGGGINNDAMDFGGTGHTSLNITGTGGAGGRTWVTVVDKDPTTQAADLVYGSGIICADVLIQQFNNRKGAGVVALYNQDPAKKGLALIITTAGNTDTLVLGTLAGDANGAFTPITSVPLGSQVSENQWYRVVMRVDVDGSSPVITGQAYRHLTPSDPNSDIAAIGATLNFSPPTLPPGVDPLGEEGIIGWAVGAVVNSSITNFSNVQENCVPPPSLGT